MTVDKLVPLLFYTRDTAHLAHLRTTSYAQHEAIGEFYNQLLDLTDDLVEAYQGYYGDFLDISIPAAHEIMTIKSLTNLDEVVNSCASDTIGIQNILDDISTLINTTLYKLKFLK